MSRKRSDYAEARGYNPYADIGCFLLLIGVPLACVVCAWLLARGGI